MVLTVRLSEDEQRNLFALGGVRLHEASVVDVEDFLNRVAGARSARPSEPYAMPSRR